MRCHRASVWLWAVVVWGCASPAEPPRAVLADGHYVMGTLFELTLHGNDAVSLAQLRDELFAQARALDQAFSRYRPESDVSRLNAGAGGPPLEVAPPVAELLRHSVAYGALTRGAFDVTVGPLVALWTQAAEADRRPTSASLTRAAALVGSQRVRIGEDGRVGLEPGMSIDLGGIAKGYALDRMLPRLRAEGISSALLSFGQSSAWAFGTPPGSEGWRLLARSPAGGFAGILTLRDDALSVSGSLGQWTEIEGRRYGHVLDPRSGEPLTRRREALVVAPNATLAEALSKALLVLGEGEGIALIEAQQDCEALLLDEEGGAWATSGWQLRTAFERLPPQAAAP